MQQALWLTRRPFALLGLQVRYILFHVVKIADVRFHICFIEWVLTSSVFSCSHLIKFNYVKLTCSIH